MPAHKITIFSDPALFSKRVGEERRKQGLTIEQLAERANIASNTLTSYLRTNSATPSLPNAMAIADALQVSLDYLCGMNVAKELPHGRKTSPETLLMNLYQAADDAGLATHADPMHSTTTFVSSNIHVAYFFSQVQRCSTLLEVRELANRFSKFAVLNHQLVDDNTYREYMENLRVYGDMTEEDLDLYPDECQRLIDDRQSEVTT